MGSQPYSALEVQGRRTKRGGQCRKRRRRGMNLRMSECGHERVIDTVFFEVKGPHI